MVAARRNCKSFETQLSGQMLRIDMGGKSLKLKPKAFLIDDLDVGQCSLILTAYKANVAYPASYNKIVFGRQFMHHFMTVLDYERDQVRLTPKRYAIENNFVDYQKPLAEEESLQLIFYVIGGLAGLFLLCICFYVCKRTPSGDYSIRNLQSSRGSVYRSSKYTKESLQFEQARKNKNKIGSQGQYSLNDEEEGSLNQSILSMKYRDKSMEGDSDGGGEGYRSSTNIQTTSANKRHEKIKNHQDMIGKKGK